MAGETLYETLGVKPDATPEEIKAAHRRAVKAAHPDAGGSRAQFDRVQLAYGLLSDQSRREDYDRTGRETHADPEALLRARATELVARHLLNLVGNPQVDPRYVDVAIALREALEEDRRRFEAQIAQSLAMQERLRQFERRLKRQAGKVGEDPMLGLIAAQIAQHQAGQRQAEDLLKGVAAAMELAEEYRYTTDARPMQTMGAMGGGWSRIIS